MNAITLSPGQNITLPRGVPLQICFETNRLPSGYEIDSCAFLLNRQGKVRGDADFIFFNQPVFCAGVLQKQPTEHEFIINPQLLPADVCQVVFSLSIYDGLSKKQNFSALSGCRGEIANSSNCEKIAEFKLDTCGMSEIALIFFVIYLHNNQWKLRALGNGFKGGLDALAAYYGVDISEGETKSVQEATSAIALPPSNAEPFEVEEDAAIQAEKPAHKKNPVEIAQELYSALMEAQASISMADIPKRKLTEMSEVTKKIVIALEHIHNKVVPLDLVTDDAIFVSNLVIWNNLPTGYILKKHVQYQRLLNNSRTLSSLHKNAIDILSVYKFSDTEITLSKKIGDFFSVNYSFYQSFKFLITQNHLGSTHLTARVREAAEINAFLQGIEKSNIIGPFQIQLFVFSTNDWVDTDVPTLRRIRSQENKIRFIFNVLDTTTYRDLITGHWFNALTYSIISDHLARNQFLHEIYTRVSYQSPSEIFKSKGDFDIIALVGKTILAVECKSGNLKENLDVDTIIDKKKGLEKVFEIVGSGQYRYLFLMIYNPFAIIDQSALDKLSEAEIKPVIPSEMRGAIFDIFCSKSG